MTDQPAAQEPLHSPEHQRAVGRIVIAGSGIEGAVSTIAARLMPNPDEALRRLGRHGAAAAGECEFCRGGWRVLAIA
jgi:hypothetical protein